MVLIKCFYNDLVLRKGVYSLSSYQIKDYHKNYQIEESLATVFVKINSFNLEVDHH